ncbi:MAG: PLP-dependent cysteine synthase family protein [Christensenellales bacterium]
MNINNIKKLVTNTPLIEITYKFLGKKNKVYAKCEWFSLTGSIKDRVAYQMLKDAYSLGLIKKGDKIVEVSSGNMGLSLSAMGNLLGNPVTILMPKDMSEERKKLIKLYGATLIETNDFLEAFKLCKEYEKQGYFCPSQFENESNSNAHEKTTAKEIIDKIKDKKVEAFVAGIGTSGTFSGVGRLLKKKLNINVIAIEPHNARIISGVKPFKKHALQGLSDEKLPKLYNQAICDSVLQITDDDAIAMTKKLCQVLSLGVGISSGANFLGCVLSNKTAITVFPDDNKKYLSTNLSSNISTPLVDMIELISFKVL